MSATARGAVGVTVALALVAAVAAAQPEGLAVRRLTPPGQPFSDVHPAAGQGAQISPDGRWIAYWFDGDDDNRFDLYIAFRFGGEPRRVSLPRPPGTAPPGSATCAFTDDSRRLVFKIDQAVLGQLELWSVPVDGGALDAVRISGTLEADEGVSRYLPLPGGEHVVITTWEAGDYHVYHAPVDGSTAPVRIDAPGNADMLESLWVAGDHVYWLDSSGGRMQLWRAPVDGSAPATRVNGDLTVGKVHNYLLSPDGTRAVYTADARVADLVELWSVPVNGPTSAAVRISPDLQAEGDVGIFRISSDSSHVAMLADSHLDGQNQLWSVPIEGPATAAERINVPLVLGGHAWLDDGAFDERVVYRADNLVVGRHQAFVVPVDGPFGASVRLHGDLDAGQGVKSVQLLPRPGEPVALLVGNLRGTAAPEPFLQHVVAPGEPYALFGGLPAGGLSVEWDGWTITPDQSSMVAIADRATAGRFQLFRLDLDFDSTPVRLSSLVTVSGADVTGFRLSPDGAWVAYRGDENVDERFDLYRVPLDGSRPPLRVHEAPSSAAQDVHEEMIWFTPDGAGIIYAADHRVDEQLDLWISDAAVFFDGFELGGTGLWSQVVP